MARSAKRRVARSKAKWGFLFILLMLITIGGGALYIAFMDIEEPIHSTSRTLEFSPNDLQPANLDGE